MVLVEEDAKMVNSDSYMTDMCKIPNGVDAVQNLETVSLPSNSKNEFPGNGEVKFSWSHANKLPSVV
jgi:hypothetical protein